MRAHPVGLLVLGFVAATGASADWKDDANARIEALRKRDAVLRVVDTLGRPVAGAATQVRQTKHRFAFGTCINTNVYSNTEYRTFFLRHFEWAVLENESKWFMNEPIRGIIQFGQADEILAVCEAHGIKMRGHNVFWAKDEYQPPWLAALPDADVRAEVDCRLEHAVPHFKGRFLHWDVNNEMLDGSFFRRRLGPDIEPYMFVRAHELDPDALLFVNDYSTVECCPSRTQAFIDEIRTLEAHGAPVHAIGVQGHYWGPAVDPVATLQGLDQLGALGKPIWITEYDCANADENARADALENLYRAAFSHPAVEGILMWGFWAGSHWRGADAAIVDLDWTLNAAGRRYEALLAEWTTSADGATAGDGAFGFRGVHGTHHVVVDAGGDGRRELDFELVPGAGPQALLVPLNPDACAPAGEVRGLALAPADGGTALRWQPPAEPDGMVVAYDVLRADDPADFTNATCVESDDERDTTALEPGVPVAGRAFAYLVRAQNVCPSGDGPLGARSDGTPRAGRSCP